MAGKATPTRKNAKSIEMHYMGAEPILDKVDSRSDDRLTKVFNWYSYDGDIKKGKVWLVSWMKANDFSTSDINKIKSVKDDYIVGTICWYARMGNNGTKLGEPVVDYMRTRITEMIATKKGKEKSEDEPEPVKVDIQQRTAAKSAYICELAEEQVVDAFMQGKKVSMYDFLIAEEVSASAAAYLKEFYLPSYNEINSGDEQVKEGYAKDFRRYRTFWTGLIDDLDRYLNNKKATRVRKPRAKKEKPLGKLVEKIQYQKEDTQLKIVSVPPQGIIGCSELWTYNTKYKKLAVFYAQGPSGLSVKGTTLTGFDPEKSVEKIARKPDEVIKSALSAGKVAIKKIMPSLKTTANVPTGRLNNNTILLKVTK